MATVSFMANGALLTTRRERAEARRIVHSWDKDEAEEQRVRDMNERLEVKSILRALDYPVQSTADLIYRGEKLNRLWELAFC